MSKEIKYLVQEQDNELDIFSLITTLKKNYIFMSILFVIFFVLSSIFVFTRANEYYANFPVDINKNVSSYIINDLKNLSKFSKEDYSALANFTLEENSSLNFIHISSISTGDRKHSAIINISAKDPKIIEPILNKVFVWVSNNIAVEKIIKEKKEKIDKLINKSNDQLKEIKILKEKILTSDSKYENQISFTGEFKIYNDRLKFIEEKDNLKAISLDSQIFISKKAKNASKVIPIFFSILISLFLSFLITLVLKSKTAS